MKTKMRKMRVYRYLGYIPKGGGPIDEVISVFPLDDDCPPEILRGRTEVVMEPSPRCHKVMVTVEEMQINQYDINEMRRIRTQRGGA